MNKASVVNAEKAFERLDMVKEMFKGYERFRVICKCMTFLIEPKLGIDIYYYEMNKTASLGNINHCNDLWICPVCARRISYKRHQEMAERFSIWNGKIFGFTFTMRHNKGQTLEEVYNLQNKAYDLFKSGKWYQGFKEKYKIVGNITGRELTWSSENGWHPHLHIAAITKMDEWSKEEKEEREKELTKEIRDRWYYCLIHVEAITGNEEDYKHCCDVDAKSDPHGERVLRYLGKWGLIEEMTLHTDKSARIGHETPFQMIERAFFLKRWGELENVEEYKKASEELKREFFEYSQVYKGVRQLRYDKGLKQLFGLAVDDLSIPEPGQAEEEVKNGVGIGELMKHVRPGTSKALLRRKYALTDLKKIADTGDINKIDEFVRKFEKEYNL